MAKRHHHKRKHHKKHHRGKKGALTKLKRRIRRALR